MDNEELDFSQLKYVLYARKSTDDPQRQVRSIGDQIFECKQLAARLGLNIVKVLEETKSAKKPNQRPIFKQMLSDLKNGVYDDILAWNPATFDPEILVFKDQTSPTNYFFSGIIPL